MAKWAWQKVENGQWVRDDTEAQRKFELASYRSGGPNGIRRWINNGRVPPEDCLRQWWQMGLISQQEFIRSSEVRVEELQEVLAAYRKADEREPSLEELFEMRAAFGSGSRVVNVITGKVTQL